MIEKDQEFYEDIEEFIDRNEDAIIEGWFPRGITVIECNLEPIYQYTIENILDGLMYFIPGEYWPEDSGDMEHQIEKVLKKFIKGVDLGTLNEKMPKVWVPNGKAISYSETELKNYLNDK